MPGEEKRRRSGFLFRAFSLSQARAPLFSLGRPLHAQCAHIRYNIHTPQPSLDTHPLHTPRVLLFRSVITCSSTAVYSLSPRNYSVIESLHMFLCVHVSLLCMSISQCVFVLGYLVEHLPRTCPISHDVRAASLFAIISILRACSISLFFSSFHSSLLQHFINTLLLYTVY